MTWEPIETAPDDRQILAVEAFTRCDDDGNSYPEEYQVVRKRNRGWATFGIYLESFQPTHWMDLPPLPINCGEKQ